MNRVIGLEMSHEMIKRDLKSPLTFEDFKNIADTAKKTPASKARRAILATPSHPASSCPLLEAQW